MVRIVTNTKIPSLSKRATWLPACFKKLRLELSYLMYKTISNMPPATYANTDTFCSGDQQESQIGV